jgi:hypothetical protein
MRLTLAALLAAGLAAGCEGADPIDTSTARAALDEADAALLSPPAPAARLFDPRARDASEHDAAIAALIDAWQAAPQDEREVQANTESLRKAREAIVRAGPAAADRIAEVCAGVPVTERADTLVCLRLLSFVDSPRSLELLAERARTPIPPWPEGAHPTDPAPEALAQEVALRSLTTRGRAGSEEAVEHLLRLVAEPRGTDRDLAIAAVYQALPRVHAKARLRAVLPANEHYRLYRTR